MGSGAVSVEPHGSTTGRCGSTGNSPVGGPEQPDYANAVLIGDSDASPESLLALAHRAEADWNRTREVRWGPRTLDIDLIAYDDVTLDTPELTLPHPRLFERAFVLAPLAEIVPDRAIGDVRIRDALAKLDQTGIEKLPPR